MSHIFMPLFAFQSYPFLRFQQTFFLNSGTPSLHLQDRWDAMHLQALDDATDVHKTSEDSWGGGFLKINPNWWQRVAVYSVFFSRYFFSNNF